MANIYRYIDHPEWMNHDSLFELRSELARFPYDQTARLLFLQNLYLLHDASFGEELRKAAFFVTDCRVLFQMIEGSHYVITPHERTLEQEQSANDSDRTLSLIDHFLHTLPSEGESKRPATPVNPAVDYVSYLLQMEDAQPETDAEPTSQSEQRKQDLIESFIQVQENEGITLPENPQVEAQPVHEEVLDDDTCLTETLARIYIKQGRYSKALEIIQRISLKNPKKNAYFADQMRFLEKLVIINKK